jgi:hypothetical protein
VKRLKGLEPSTFCMARVVSIRSGSNVCNAQRTVPSAVALGVLNEPTVDRRLSKKERTGRCSLWLLQGAEFAGKEDEWVSARRGVQGVDVSDDDPVVAGRVLCDDLALEFDEGVRQ